MALASDDVRTPASPAEIEAASASIVYGSDFPNIPYPLSADHAAPGALGLSAAARRRILRENARRLNSRLADAT